MECLRAWVHLWRGMSGGAKRLALHPITKLKMEMTMRLQQRPFTVEIKKKRPLAKPAPALPVSSIKQGKPA